jgi:O-antigen ligase
MASLKMQSSLQSFNSQAAGISPQRVPWAIPSAFSIFVAGFLLATTSGMALLGERGVFLGYIFGAGAAFVGVLRVLQVGITVPAEVALFAGFLAWSVFSGVAVAVDLSAFNVVAERLVYIAVVFVGVACTTSSLRSPDAVLAASLVLAVVMVVFGIASGNFLEASEMSIVRGRVTGTRATALTSNPNTLAMICLWGLVAVAQFVASARRQWLRGGLIAAAALLLLGIVLSGSRKSFLVAIVFGVAWLWFCHRRYVLRNLQVFLLVGVLGVGAYFGVAAVLRSTLLGHRLMGIVAEEGPDSSTATRLMLAQEGLEMFLSRPLTGVGLNQVVVLSALEKYSHSDYVEVFANTGVVGGALYFGIYLLALKRLRFVHRWTGNPRTKHAAGVCLAALLTYAVVAAAQVIYIYFESMVFLSSIIGFAHGAERQLRHELRNQTWRPRPTARTDADRTFRA